MYMYVYSYMCACVHTYMSPYLHTYIHSMDP